MEKLDIPYPVIVEGRYDVLRLQTVLNAHIIPTDGFGIFRSGEKKTLLRALAAKTPLIVLTDPDGAGGVIRSGICGMLPPERVIRLYVPRTPGKEKRKASPSAEGVLGVEGISPDILRELFAPYAGRAAESLKSGGITPADLYRDGLTGRPGSASARDEFGKSLGLPPGMNAKAFLSAIGFLLTRDEYTEKIRESRFGGSGRD